MNILISWLLALIIAGGIVTWVTIIKNRSSSQPTPPAPTPATPAPAPPAPAAKISPAQSGGWLRPIVVILVVVGLIAAGWQAMQISKTATVPAPPAPKKVMKERIFPLEFLGGKDLIRGPGWIGIRKGGYATFRVAGLPIREDGKYEIVFHGTRKSTGRDVLLINNGKGNGGAPFFYETHPASDRSIEIAFFRQGMAGNAKYFYPTGNFLQLSADDDLLVQLDQPMYVKLKYME